MNIKDAGRYANFLEKVIEKLDRELYRHENLYNTVEKHLRFKSNAEAQDETIEVKVEREFNISIEDLSYLIINLIDEKIKLALSIEDAKQNIKLDWKLGDKNLTLDSAIEYNKKLREYIGFLKYSVDAKSTETNKTAQGKKFNVEGNQVNYAYDVTIVKTINFDRNVTSNLYKKILTQTDKISTEIDEAMLKDTVNYFPLYSIHDSIDDLINEYLKSKPCVNPTTK